MQDITSPPKIQNSDHFDIWTSRYIDGDIFLLNDSKIYVINSFDNIQFVGDLQILYTLL